MIEPFPVAVGPGLLALPVDVAVAKERLGNPVARRGAGATQIVSAAHQVTQPLLRGGGWRHEEELPGAVEAHQLLGVTAVGLYPISGADRYQRGRDHVAGHPHCVQQPIELKAAGPGLVGDRQGSGIARPLDEATYRSLGVLQAAHLWGAAAARQHPCDERVLVDVEDDPLVDIGGGGGANVWHGLVLLRMRHWPLRSLSTAKLTRDICERRGPARFGVHVD